jgi:hypothetical protein
MKALSLTAITQEQAETKFAKNQISVTNLPK